MLGIESTTGYYYVYELIDPRTGSTFYVGKGTGNRMYAHAEETRRILKSGRMMKLSCKHKRILEIWDAGFEVIYHQPHHTDDEERAFQEESKLIKHYGLERLTNETYGVNLSRRRTRV